MRRQWGRIRATVTAVVATHDPVLAARMNRIVRLDEARLEGAA